MSNQWRTVNFAARYRVPFQTPEALDEYLAGVDQGDRIACLVCGRAFRNVGIHARRAHGMSPRDYCRDFGIPVTVGLVSQRAREAYNFSAQMKFATNPVVRAALVNGRGFVRTLNVPGVKKPAHSVVSKEKSKRRARARWSDPVKKARLAAALSSPEAVAKARATSSGAESKAKRLAAARAYWASPEGMEAREAVGERARGRSASPRTRQKRSEWMKAFWADPVCAEERRAKMRAKRSAGKL